MKHKQTVYRLVLFAVGMLLNAFGIYLVIVSGMGTHPTDAIAIGLKNRFGLTIGMWLNINSFLMVLAAALILREKPRMSCFLVSILFGFLLDGWGFLLFHRLEEMSFSIAAGVALFVGGVVVNSVGIAIYLCTSFPVSALDNLMLSIKQRLRCSLLVSRLLMEGGLSIAGWLLGGPIGWGTLTIVLGFSFLIESAHRLVLPLYRKGLAAINREAGSNVTF